MNKQEVVKWMKSVAAEYEDSYGDLNCTQLAEAACRQFDLYGPPPTYDAPDELFDWGVDVDKWYFRRR